MKKILLFCALLFSICVYSQSIFPSTNARWLYRFSDEVGNITNSYLRYEMKGDTIISPFTYKKIFQDSTYIASIRESNKKVYLIQKDSIKENLIYDFNLNKGDSFFSKIGWGPERNWVIKTDSIEALDGMHRQLRLAYCVTWIEGIGSPHNLIRPSYVTCLSGYYHLICFTIDNNLVYPKFFSTCNVSLPVQITKNIDITISPNPFHSFTKIQCVSVNGNSDIYIYNSMGELVRKEKMLDNTCFQLDRGSLANGIYFIQVVNKNGVTGSHKLVIE